MKPRWMALAAAAFLMELTVVCAGAQTQSSDTTSLDSQISPSSQNVQTVTYNVVTTTAWDSKTLIPLRDVAEEIGGRVRWNAKRKMIVATANGTTAEVKVGSRLAYINGRPYRMVMTPTTVSGMAMVPVDFVHEAFGVVIGWNGPTRTITLITPSGSRFSRGTTSTVTARINDNASSPDDGVRFSPNLPSVRTGGDNEAFQEYMRGRDFANNAADRDFIRFLESQDFKRYQANKADLISAYTDYRSAMANGTLANQFTVPRGTNLAAFDRYLIWRDFNAFADNRAMWRTNYAAFLNWRRAMDGDRGSAAWNSYLQDRRDMMANVERAYQNSRAGGATSGGNAGPNR